MQLIAHLSAFLVVVEYEYWICVILQSNCWFSYSISLGRVF